jgi:hypothetical protein
VEREPLAEAVARDLVLEEAGIGLLADASRRQTALESGEGPTNEDDRILDTEFVAIYW